MFAMSSVTEGKFSGLPTPTERRSAAQILDSESLGYFLAVKLVGLVDFSRILGILLVDNFVQIFPLLEANGYLFPDCLQGLQINVSHDDVLRLPCLGQDVPPGPDDGGVTPGYVRGLGVPGRGRCGYKQLVVQSSGPGQQLPVSWTCRRQDLPTDCPCPGSSTTTYLWSC